MFNNNYKLTDAHSNLKSAIAACADISLSPSVGAYSNGLLMVVDAQSGNSLLRHWSWLVGKKCSALMTTGFGDVFFWNPANGVSFLEVQRAAVEFIDTDIGWFLSEFLVNPEIVDKVLKKGRFDELVRLKRPLAYHEAFILEPWLMLGGQESPENYNIGECAVYVDLVAQSCRRSH